MSPVLVTLAVGLLMLGVLILIQVRRRAARDAAGSAALAASIASRRHIPPTLHPVIDTDLCIGSLSCLKACPEGDILGVINGAARLIHADHCIGHGRCAAECPVDAIKLVFGTAERGIDLPEVDAFFESSRAGVHVVGELAGMGLIKNAIIQGLQAAERLDEVLPKPAQATEETDVVVVGAGPAGLATAAELKKRGRSVRVLEQGSVGGTVAQYPRQKVVMTETLQVPFLGKFGKSLIAKEELLGSLQKLIEKAGIAVEEGVKVTGLEGKDGAFTVKTDKGAVAARKVVLACGRRGTPRKLGAKGEELSKVSYRLDDPEQYDGCAVLVVGGGDSALEAAIQLAEQSTAVVSLSYRGESFSKCRERNRQQLDALVKKERINQLMSTSVLAIDDESVTLSRESGPELQLPNQFVIVQAGGEVPSEFLQKMGVQMRRYQGEERGAPKPKEKGGSADAALQARSRSGLARERGERHRTRIIRLLYLGVGLVILALLASAGWEYYELARFERFQSPLHARLKPSGSWGHGVGIVATLFMLLNFLYPVRKRSRRMTGFGSIRGWLDFHMFVGIMSPLVIAFHAAFQSNNMLATSTASALVIVVSTGLIGRFIYGLVPSRGGQAVEVAELRGALARLDARVRPLLESAQHHERLEALLSHAEHEAPGRGFLALLGQLLLLPFTVLALRFKLRMARSAFAAAEDFAEFAGALRRMELLRLQIDFFGALKAFLRSWRLFHASLAVFLVLIMTAHIGFSLYLGYGLQR